MSESRLRWRYSVLSALTLFTLFLLFSSSASRFKLSGWSDDSNIDLSGQFEYQPAVVAGAPVQVPAPSSDSTTLQHGSHPPSLDVAGPGKRPHKIVGMVFAGRKEYVSILDCYLQRNLVRNGGWLDEIMFIMHVNRTQDIVYLHDLTDNVPEYTLHEIYGEEEEDNRKPFSEAYKLCKPGTLYVKIDDDLLFMEDNAIQSIVQRKVDNPECVMVSANVINSPAASWVTQHHLGATKPYLPESSIPDGFVDDDRRHMVDWRSSTLPHWESNSAYNFTIGSSPPFKGHRWLPLGKGDYHFTPADSIGRQDNISLAKNASSEYLPWTVAAQQHYSFLEHLEKGQLSLYKFDNWTYDRTSRNINFIAFSGDDVVKHPVSGNDGTWFTQKLPSQLKQSAVVDGSAIVVHFGTRFQTSPSGGIPGRGLRDTDLLRRYRSYATEFICGKPWGSPMH
ncbi:hypothetical protein LTR84_007110 [Exophiala bonariae]|uniref:Uncharacterized protein n=1 Tax=Exophiala bonariae TaxID=1690606 RepID=A0AAV9N3E4_9EURO|nr:hypothetical protein LTR84_007110 [Exophiala bonariae]